MKNYMTIEDKGKKYFCYSNFKNWIFYDKTWYEPKLVCYIGSESIIVSFRVGTFDASVMYEKENSWSKPDVFKTTLKKMLKDCDFKHNISFEDVWKKVEKVYKK